MRGSRSDNPRYINGVSIWENLIGRNVTLVMKIRGDQYRVKHDDLVAWIADNAPTCSREAGARAGTTSWASPHEK
jgi:NADPH-dependent curcumin reductase CurA